MLDMIDIPKYRLTDETIEHNGVTLHRIQAARDFGNVASGMLGGYIENEDNLSHDETCWVADTAKVYGTASVLGRALVSCDAEVYGDARVYGDATVSGSARVYGDASISEHARVFGEAHVRDDAAVEGHAFVHGNAIIENNADLDDRARVMERAVIGGDTRLRGGTRIAGSAVVRIDGCLYDTGVFGSATLMGTVEANGATLRDETVTVPVIVVNGLRFRVTITDNTVTIGCQHHSFDHWREHGRDIMEQYVSRKHAKRMMKALKPLMKHQEKRVRKAAKSR